MRRLRVVLISGLLIPFGVSASFVYGHETFEAVGSLGYVAATIVFTVAAFGLYATVVTTLASRRQNLFLKRLRSTAAKDADILVGLVLPGTVLAILQVVGIFVVLAVVARGPADVLLLSAAIMATVTMLLALGLATAGLTNSPEHALSDSLLLLGPTLGWVLVAVVAAVKLFGWEPRR